MSVRMLALSANTASDTRDTESIVETLNTKLFFTLQLTLWLRDLGIKYKTEQREEEQEDWLDNMLWLCAAEDGKIADSEVFMKECVVLNLFNQLRTSLTTAESYPLSIPQECVLARNELTKCVANDRRYNREVVTNGHVVRKLLRQLRESKSSV